MRRRRTTSSSSDTGNAAAALTPSGCPRARPPRIAEPVRVAWDDGAELRGRGRHGDGALVMCSDQGIYQTRGSVWRRVTGLPAEKIRVQYYAGSNTYGSSCYTDVGGSGGRSCRKNSANRSACS